MQIPECSLLYKRALLLLSQRIPFFSSVRHPCSILPSGESIEGRPATAAHRKFQTQLHLVRYNKDFKKYVEITLCRFEESQKLVDKSTDRLVSLMKCRLN